MGLLRVFIDRDLDVRDIGAWIEVPLDRDSAHHAGSVRRLGSGSLIEIVEPAGRVITVRLDQAPSTMATGIVMGIAPPGARTDVTLFQGVTKGDKLNLVVEKAVEIGVDAVIPVIFDRSVVQLTSEKRIARGERLRRVALAAAKQSRRNSVADVSDPIDFAEAVTFLSRYDIVLLAIENELDAKRVSSALGLDCQSPSVAIIVGPEGGLTPGELQVLRDLGAQPVSLGRNILRAETAGIVAVAFVIDHLQGLVADDGASRRAERP